MPQLGSRHAQATAAAFAGAVALLLASAAGALAAHRPAPPWEAAEAVRGALFEAQSSLLLGEAAERDAAAAQAALSGPLQETLAASAPSELGQIDRALADAGRAASASDEVALADARGRAVAALRRASYAITVAATAAGDVGTASAWLLVRDFRAATRFTRPSADATEALSALEAGEIDPSEAATEVKKDLLDAYQAQLSDNLADSLEGDRRGFAARRAETAEIAAGYWLIIRPEYVKQRDAETAAALDASFARLANDAAEGGRAFEADAAEIEQALDGFTAAAFTPEEQARRATQLLRFVDLVPVEYGRGTEDGRVTKDFEIQEAAAFLDGTDAAFADLKGALEQRDAAAVAEIDAALARMRTLVTTTQEGGTVAADEDVEAERDTAKDGLERIMPDEWKESGEDADFDLIQISLDQMQAALGAGEYSQAEQARLAAYAFLDFGPELKLKAFNPQLALELEALFWYGADGHRGLAELVADHASVGEVRDTRVPLDEKLGDAQSTLGEGTSATTAIVNSALIVFREGLEGILILAAITASLTGARRRLRRPILRGALIALPASIALFVASLSLLDTLSRFGEKLEAVVGLIAIAVLLVTLNWFFHRVYWTEWISSHRARGKQLTAGAATGAGVAGATVAGLYLLGFTSVFREGFETVLFLQAVQLSSGTGVVVAGVVLGLIATGIVGGATFALEQRMPYKKMLIVTGVLISLVLVSMVGNTARVMQAVGWLPINPFDVQFPLWTGTWLGVFPTMETITAQVVALAFVLGSYFLAEYVRKRNIRRAVEETEAREAEDAAVAANGNGSGNGRAKPALDPDAPRIDSGSRDHTAVK